MIFRSVPISEHPGHTKLLILLRRLVFIALEYERGLTNDFKSHWTNDFARPIA
jgi:hypothetical protein